MSIEAEPQAIEEDAGAVEEAVVDATSTDGQQSDLAPDESAESEEKVTFDDRQQAKVNELIGEKTRERHEAERRAVDLERQLAEAQARIPEPTKPAVPELPDPFDDDFAAKMAARDRQLQEAAQFDADQRVREQMRQNAEQQALQDQQTKANNQAHAYFARAAESGVTQAELVPALQELQKVGGLGDVVGNHIMDEDDGRLTVRIGTDPVLIDKIKSMSPAKAVLFIENEVRPSLSGKRASTAPQPAKRVPSRGVPSTFVDAPGITIE